jgi:hypothetical protein
MLAFCKFCLDMLIHYSRVGFGSLHVPVCFGEPIILVNFAPHLQHFSYLAVSGSTDCWSGVVADGFGQVGICVE